MSNYLYTTDFLVPAGTPLAAPLIQPVPLQDYVLTSVRIIIPDGHNGLTGISVRSAAVNIVPFTQGTYLIGNNEEVNFDYGGQVGENQLALYGYNTDIFDHAFHFRWQLADIGPAGSPIVIASPQLVPLAAADSIAVQQLSGGADALDAADVAALAALGG